MVTRPQANACFPSTQGLGQSIPDLLLTLDVWARQGIHFAYFTNEVYMTQNMLI